MTIDRDHLDRIRDAQHQLDDLDTKLGGHLAAIEAALRSVVSVRIETALDEEHDLEYGKHNGSWRLVVIGPDGKPCPLASCSREVRVRVVLGGTVERLIREAGTQIDAMIEERERAIVEAMRLIGALDAAAAERAKQGPQTDR